MTTLSPQNTQSCGLAPKSIYFCYVSLELIGQFRGLADHEPRDLRCFTLRYPRWVGPKLSNTPLDTSRTIQEFLTEASYCFEPHYFIIIKSLLYKKLSDVRILYAVYGENMWAIGTADGNPIVLKKEPALSSRTLTEHRPLTQPLFSYLFALFFSSKSIFPSCVGYVLKSMKQDCRVLFR